MRWDGKLSRSKDRVDCWLKPITCEALTRYCDALHKNKLRKWGFWGGAIGFCWRDTCATRGSLFGQPHFASTNRGPKMLIWQWFCIKCLCTLSNYHCATSSLDVLTSQHNARLWAPAVGDGVVGVWQATMAGDVIPKKIAVDDQGINWCYVPYTWSTCLMRVFGLTSLNWSHLLFRFLIVACFWPGLSLAFPAFSQLMVYLWVL